MTFDSSYQLIYVCSHRFSMAFHLFYGTGRLLSIGSPKLHDMIHFRNPLVNLHITVRSFQGGGSDFIDQITDLGKQSL